VLPGAGGRWDDSGGRDVNRGATAAPGEPGQPARFVSVPHNDVLHGIDRKALAAGQ